MRKQKLFKRVSAWLLAWTMVLSALSGSVTVWAQEPEEVEVRIEAQSEREIEAEDDAQIGEDTEGEAEINAEEGSQDESGAERPVIGFYKDTPSGERLSEEYKYNPGETICVVIDTDKVSLEEKDYGIFLDGENLSEEERNEMVKPGTDDAAYTITIPGTCKKEFSILVWAKDEVECLKMAYDTSGLHGLVLRVQREEDFDLNVVKKNMRKSLTINLGEEEHICFRRRNTYSLDTLIPVYPYEQKWYYFDNKAEVPSFVAVTEENKETYGTIKMCNDSPCSGNGFVWVDLKKEGIYKVEYNSGSPDSSAVIIKTQYPEFGFYTDSQVSDEKFAGIKLGDTYDYGNEEGGRIVYFLKRDDVKAKVKGAHAIWNGKDKTKEFIETEEVSNGLKITVDPDCQQDFDLQIEIEKEDGEPEQKTFHFYDSYQPEIKDYDDGQPKKAFSGCMLTEWAFRSGLPWDEKNCTPVNRYWVHGNTAQEVLDKLTKSVSVTGTNEEGEETTVTIPNTGYYYITMSCYTGDAVSEDNQKKEQTITLSGDVKGVVMDSGSEREVAWESEDKDFVNGKCEPVYDIDGKKYCYLGYEEGKVGKWYAAEWNEAASLYVYNPGAYIGVYKPAPNSPEWARGFGECHIFNKDFSWPNLVLDVTTGHAPVRLAGQWLQDNETGEKAGVKIIYSNKKDTEFEVDVCGRKITKEDVAQSVIVKEMDDDGSETENVITTVSFELERCKHEGETEEKDAKEATCTEAGHEDNTYCKDCGEKLEDGKTIPATGHSTEVRGEKKATCTALGYTGDTYCKDCGKKIKDGEDIKAIGHKWDTGKITKPATETEKGVKTYTCQNGCGETRTEDIPVLEKKPDSKPEQPQPEQPQPQPQGAKIEDPAGGDTYKVTSDPQAKEPTVEYTAPKKGAKGTVKVPDSVTVDGVVYKVTAIADNAFKGNKKVTKVTVGKNVISIGRNAFSGCAKLKSVTIGAGVMEIGDSAFKGCTALTKITLPAKVQKIGKNAFASCKKLKTITIKSTKLTDKSISKGAFKGLTAKTTIKVPRSKLKAYKALFKKKGLSKKVKVKA